MKIRISCELSDDMILSIRKAALKVKRTWRRNGEAVGVLTVTAGIAMMLFSAGMYETQGVFSATTFFVGMLAAGAGAIFTLTV